MRRNLFCLLAAMLLVLLLLPSAVFGEELRGYVKGESYQYVLLGEYPYEADGTVQPVLWRVLTADNGSALLLTEYIIDTKQIIFETDPKIIEKHAFRRISSYAESDLYTWLNSEGVETLFGEDPIRSALISEEGSGLLFPLTDEQYLDADTLGFSTGRWGEELNAYPRRQAVATPYAVANGLLVNRSNGKSSYWCNVIKARDGYYFGLVGYNGHISWGAYTNTKVAGLRLAIRLDLNQIRIAGGEGTRENPWTLSCTVSAPPPEPPAPDGPVPEESAAEPETAPATEPVTEADRENTALLSFIGDCSIGDGYRTIRSENSYHSVVAREGYTWPFSLVKDYLASDDLTIANLEVVLTKRNSHKDIMYPLRAAPEHVNILLEGSIEVVNTVNNHCWDYLRDGYVDSLAVLDEAGIARFGSVYYTRKDGFDDLLVKDVNGIRFGFIGITYPQSSDTQNVIRRIRKLKDEDSCDIVIVSLHWGRETYMKQESSQEALVRTLIDGGADVIYGHHPHVLQPIAFYQGKPIMFSTGNFTFGTMSKVDPHTGIFRFTYRKTGDRVLLSEIEVIPCQTSGAGDYRPFIQEDEAEREKTFRILTSSKVPAKCENPPEYFLETGRIMFDENGMIMPEM